MDADTIMSIGREYALGRKSSALAKKYGLKRDVIEKKLEEVFIPSERAANYEQDGFVSSSALVSRLGFHVGDLWTVLECERLSSGAAGWLLLLKKQLNWDLSFFRDF